MKSLKICSWIAMIGANIFANWVFSPIEFGAICAMIITYMIFHTLQTEI